MLNIKIIIYRSVFLAKFHTILYIYCFFKSYIAFVGSEYQTSEVQFQYCTSCRSSKNFSIFLVLKVILINAPILVNLFDDRKI